MNPTVDPETSTDFSRLLAVGDVAAAQRLAATALKKNPSDPEACSVLARIALLDLDGAAARAHLDRAAHRDSPGMRLAEAGMAALEGNDDRALAFFEQALNDETSSVEARFGQGISLARLGRIPEALEALSVAVKDAPHSGHLRYHLGRCQLEAGQVEAGVVSLGKAVELDPFLPDAWAALARAISVSGQKNRAEEILTEALRLHPGQSTLLTELANLRLSSGAVKEGLAVLAEVAEANPEDPAAAANEAMRRIAEGEVRSAIDFCLNKRDQGVWGAGLARALADAYEASGDFEAALVAYADATELDPSDWRAPNNMGWIIATMGKPEQLPHAVEVLEKANQRAPSQLEPLLNLAIVYGRMERADTALYLARHVASKDIGEDHPVHQQALRLVQALQGSIEPGGSNLNPEPS